MDANDYTNSTNNNSTQPTSDTGSSQGSSSIYDMDIPSVSTSSTTPATNTTGKEQMSEAEMIEALKNMSNEEVIEVFIEGLIIDKGQENLPEEEKENLRDELYEKVEDFLSQALVNALPDGGVADLDNMIDAGDVTPEKIKKLLDDAGVDSGAVIVNALVKFRELYLNPNENKMEA